MPKEPRHQDKEVAGPVSDETESDDAGSSTGKSNESTDFYDSQERDRKDSDRGGRVGKPGGEV